MFLCLSDGSGRVELDGGRSQAQLWKALKGTLRRAYVDDVGSRTRGLLEVLDQFDRVDAVIGRLTRRLDKELETNGGKSRRCQALQEQLRAACTTRSELLARERRLLEADCKPHTGAKTGAGTGGSK